MSGPIKTPVNISELALQYAVKHHGNQVRKYTGEPYVAHVIEVAELVRTIGFGDDNMIAAAYLHDVVEDCDVNIDRILYDFGWDIKALVNDLTDFYTSPEHGNRATRKSKERQRWLNASDRAKTIKLADLLSNSKSIVEHDPDFARVFIPEMALLLPYLSGGSRKLFEKCLDVLEKNSSLTSSAAIAKATGGKK